MALHKFETAAGLEAFVRTLAGTGQVVHVLMLHDDDCRLGALVPCSCSPWFQVTVGTKEEVAKAMTEGVKVERAWFDSRRS